MTMSKPQKKKGRDKWEKRAKREAKASRERYFKRKAEGQTVGFAPSKGFSKKYR
jgi:hypothetical protein